MEEERAMVVGSGEGFHCCLLQIKLKGGGDCESEVVAMAMRCVLVVLLRFCHKVAIEHNVEDVVLRL